MKTHTIRLNPTPEQTQYFLRASGIARFVWNWALCEYKAIKARGEIVDWNALKKRFTAIKSTDFPFVGEVTKCAPAQAFADLRQAINTYYKAKPSQPKLRFPGLRKRSKKIGGFGLANDKFSLNGHTARVPRLGDVNIAESLRFAGKIMSGRIIERAGHWYLMVTVEVDPPEPLDLHGSTGIDFGLKRFATLSTGEVWETQAYFRRSEHKLKLLQRGLARKKRGSKNRAKWKGRVTRLHERIRHQRQDFLHKFTTHLATRYALISVEDLNLRGLVQTRLAKSFSDAGIGEAIHQLDYKTTWVGGWLQKVGRFFPSSKLCHACGVKNDDLTLWEREWTCICGACHDRDLNAAVNIDTEGIRLLAGNGFLGSTPVKFAATTLGFDHVHVADSEAGT